jgi:MSHA biogenesis protein MshJ
MTWWQKIPFIDGVTAYEKFSSREQYMVLSTIIVVILLIAYLLVIEPVILINAQLIKDKNSLISTTQSLSENIINTKNKKLQDPNTPLRKQLKEVLVESKRLQKKINLLTQALVAPKQMVSLLESVLTQDKQLKLISLINLPEEAMSMQGSNLIFNDSSALDANTIRDRTSGQDRNSGQEALIYRHTFNIELETTYDSALLYLKRLDDLPWQLFWQDLKYQSTQYPKGTLNIRIYTLSMSKEVLGV